MTISCSPWSGARSRPGDGAESPAVAPPLPMTVQLLFPDEVEGPAFAIVDAISPEPPFEVQFPEVAPDESRAVPPHRRGDPADRRRPGQEPPAAATSAPSRPARRGARPSASRRAAAGDRRPLPARPGGRRRRPAGRRGIPERPGGRSGRGSVRPLVIAGSVAAGPPAAGLEGLVAQLTSAEAKGARGRPRVTISYAQSLDGSIAARPGEPLRLSGSRSLELTHRLRAGHDAILVGIGTVLADDPRLNVRLVAGDSPAAGHPRRPASATHLRPAAPGPRGCRGRSPAARGDELRGVARAGGAASRRRSHGPEVPLAERFGARSGR